MILFESEEEDSSASEDFDLEETVAPSTLPMPQSMAVAEAGGGGASAAATGRAAAAAAGPTATTTSTSNENSATKAASALIIAASDKAGMAGIDRERINSILLRESANSTFMQRQRKMDEHSNRRIEEMKRRLECKDGISSTASATNNNNNSDWRKEMKQSTIDPLLREYQSRRANISTCVVIDMDGFFISCHTLLDPKLATKPACVGGSSMISTSNYAARRYGVRAAMPGYLGRTLVTELSGGKESLTFVKSDFGLYKRKSAEVNAILEEYDPRVKMHSLDEGYMDIGPYLEVMLLDNHEGGLCHDDIRKILLDKRKTKHSKGDPSSANENENRPPAKKIHEILPLSTIHEAARNLLRTIRQHVENVTGLTCSAGLASNFLLAKIASDMNKPNGQYFVGPSETQILDFVNPLPLRKVNGVGRVMEKTLRAAFGIETVGDLYEKRAEVYFSFKKASAAFLMRACIGHAEGRMHHGGETPRPTKRVGDAEREEALHRKGISHERTFSPTTSWSDMCTRLEGITLGLVRDLRERNLRPKTITLKVKLANFDILSRATTRAVALFQNCNDRQSARDLVDIVVHLLKEAKREYEYGGGGKKGKIASSSTSVSNSGSSPFSLRLLGVRCSNFQLEKNNQSSLDRYRPVGQLDDDSEKHPGDSKETRDNNRLMVKNPYSPKGKKNPYCISPKAMPPSGNTLGDQTKISNTSSKRALYTSPGPKIGVRKMPPETGGVNKIMSSRQIQCPVCQKHFESNQRDNAEINAHIDACLNATTVKHLAKEETRWADARTRKKKRRLADFFTS